MKRGAIPFPKEIYPIQGMYEAALRRYDILGPKEIFIWPLEGVGWPLYINFNIMEDELKSALAAAESWSVNYEGDVYGDSRKVDGNWYFRTGLVEEFRCFPFQEKITPICKNLTRREDDSRHAS